MNWIGIFLKAYKKVSAQMDPLVNHTKIQNRTNTTSSDTLPKNRRGSNIS